MERGTVIDQFIYCVNSYREAAMSNDAKFDHIDLSEKQQVIARHFLSQLRPLFAINSESLFFYFILNSFVYRF